MIDLFQRLMLALLIGATGVFGDVRAQSSKPPTAPSGVSVPLVVYGAMDRAAFAHLKEGFQERYPGIAVDYHELNSNEIYERLAEKSADATTSPDLVLSSAMDLQIKLVNDGYALSYYSPTAWRLPSWAVWRDEAFGFTFEPAVIVYNKTLVPEQEVPHSRAELIRLLDSKPERYLGKIATYDPERSGLGFLFATQDAKQSPIFWDLARSLGASGVKLYTSSAAILDHIAAGNYLLGYNLLGSYALARAQNDPAIGIVLPQDYTLVMSRIAFIPKTTAHPELAKLLLDFLLSEQGQRILSAGAKLYSIHPDVRGEMTAAQLQEDAAGSLRPIRVGPGLLVYLDQVKRGKFLQQWNRALRGR